MNVNILKSFFCLIIVSWAVFTDVRYRKIKNYTVVVGILGGLALNMGNIKPALVGLLLPLILILLFSLNMMGAGDIKLLSSVGTIMCFPKIVDIILYSFVFCGVHILISTIAKRGMRKMICNIWSDIWFFILTRKINKEFSDSKRIPMAGSIAVATLLTILKQAFKI